MNRTLILAGMALALAGGAMHAATPSCLAQRMKAMPTGQPPVGAPVSATPEREVAYVITLSSACRQTLDHLVIDRAVPRGMIYVKTTAKGDGTDRVFSTDGATFGRWDDLRVAGEGGALRPIRPEDVRVIRWVFKEPLSPGSSRLLHYHLLRK